MNILKKVFDWIVWSSVNPDKISMTLKGLIPFIVLLNFSNTTTLGQTADIVVNSLVLLGTAVAACVAAYGGMRKVAISISSLFYTTAE